MTENKYFWFFCLPRLEIFVLDYLLLPAGIPEKFWSNAQLGEWIYLVSLWLETVCGGWQWQLSWGMPSGWQGVVARLPWHAIGLFELFILTLPGICPKCLPDHKMFEEKGGLRQEMKRAKEVLCLPGKLCSHILTQKGLTTSTSTKWVSLPQLFLFWLPL